MASAVDKFSELEGRIGQTVELVKSLRKQIAALEQENAELRRERDLVKNKIETLLENLAEVTEETLV